MTQGPEVYVFWDASAPPKPNVGGYSTVKAIRSLGSRFGVVKALRFYVNISGRDEKEGFSTSSSLASELQCSGVSIINVMSDGSQGASSKMLLTDCFIHAMEHSPFIKTSVMVIISSDPDLGYAISLLRSKGHQVVLICPLQANDNLLKLSGGNDELEGDLPDVARRGAPSSYSGVSPAGDESETTSKANGTTTRGHGPRGRVGSLADLLEVQSTLEIRTSTDATAGSSSPSGADSSSQSESGTPTTVYSLHHQHAAVAQVKQQTEPSVVGGIQQASQTDPVSLSTIPYKKVGPPPSTSSETVFSHVGEVPLPSFPSYASTSPTSAGPLNNVQHGRPRINDKMDSTLFAPVPSAQAERIFSQQASSSQATTVKALDEAVIGGDRKSIVEASRSSLQPRIPFLPTPGSLTDLGPGSTSTAATARIPLASSAPSNIPLAQLTEKSIPSYFNVLIDQLRAERATGKSIHQRGQLVNPLLARDPNVFIQAGVHGCQSPSPIRRYIQEAYELGIVIMNSKKGQLSLSPEYW